MTDARHHCRKNSYHTDHVAIGMQTHKVVDIQHINRKDDNCTQRHEVMGFDRMYADFAANGIKVTHHAHDRNMSINKRLREGKQAKNSNDRWHCTRAVTSNVKKMGACTKAIVWGKTWHPQLADKSAVLRNHVYWCMDHCNGDANELRRLIDSCITHFQGDHSSCHISSGCRAEGYRGTETIVITDPVALQILTRNIHSLVVYKNAEDYVHAHDTYYVESFNNVCLIYLDKRIHYRDTSYMIRSNLSVLDWNEHVDRPYTSIHRSFQSRSMRQRSGTKVYKKKTYNFVEKIWKLYLQVWKEPNERLASVDDISANDNVEESESDNSGSSDADLDIFDYADSVS